MLSACDTVCSALHQVAAYIGLLMRNCMCALHNRAIPKVTPWPLGVSDIFHIQDIGAMHTTHNLPAVPTAERLSMAWLFILLTMIFRDLHEFGRPGFIEEIASGVVNGIRVTEGLMLFGGVLATLPIAMVFLSRLLPVAINRITNGVVAFLQALLLAPNLGNDLDDKYFAALQLLAIAAILWMVIRWRAPAQFQAD